MRYPAQPTAPATPPSNTGGQYFDRRGEVNELKQGLRTALAERDSEKMKDNIRRVIGYMTLGIDMSRLFSEMVMAAQFGDIVHRKMVYLYLTTYAKSSGDLAILTINTLQKDTRDVDPSIRGLALRSICSMHMENMLEYLVPAITTGLSDGSGYVRKTAVFGVLKLYDLVSRKSLPSSEITLFEHQLVSMLSSDPDPMVTTNIILALEEMRQLVPVITKELVYSLLRRFGTFSEWGRSIILNSVLARYSPSSDDELFEIMNCLDIYMHQTSVNVSLEIFKLFLTWTSGDLQAQVLVQIKNPLLSLLSASSASVEMQLVVVAQVEFLLTQFGKICVPLFAPHWRQFVLTEFDSTELARTKVAVLSKFAATTFECSLVIISELKEYLTIFPEVEREVVTALVEVGTSGEYLGTEIYGVLRANLSPITLEGLCDLLAFFPDLASPEDLSVMVEERLEDSASAESLCWLLGEYGREIPESAYFLEQLEKKNLSEENLSNPPNTPSLQVALVTAGVKLFLARPVDCHQMVQRLIAFAIEAATAPEVRDTGLMYYRLMHAVGPKKMADGLTSAANLVVPANESLGDVAEFNAMGQTRFSVKCAV